MKTNRESKVNSDTETNDDFAMTNTNWAQRTNPNWSSHTQTAWKNHDKLLESARSKGMAPPPPIGVVGTRYTSKSSSFGVIHITSAALFIAALGIFGFIFLKPMLVPQVEETPVVELKIPKNPNKRHQANGDRAVSAQPASPQEAATDPAIGQTTADQTTVAQTTVAQPAVEQVAQPANPSNESQQQRAEPSQLGHAPASHSAP